MTEFSAELRKRVQEAEVSLRDARADGDDFLVEVRLGELESLRRLAASHGVALDGAPGGTEIRLPDTGAVCA